MALPHLSQATLLMVALRVIYSLLWTAGAVTIVVLICNFSIESITTQWRGGLTTRRQYYGDEDVLRQTTLNSSTINDKCNLSLIRKLQSNSNGFHPLPSSVVAAVKTFVFFIGIGRSGHSIVASILDSHPHIVVSNELNIFEMLDTFLCHGDIDDDKSFILNQIWQRSYTQAMTSLKETSKGYTSAIDGLYQGSYDSHVDVIGDEMGGSTIALYLSNPSRFEDQLIELRSLLNVPIKVFHVIRNPFDNIATKSLHVALKLDYSRFATVKKDNISVTVSDKIIDKEISQYFQFFEAAKVIKHSFNIDTMELHNGDLITTPKVVIRKMCDFLDVHCSDDYLNVTSNKVFNSKSKTRYNIKWNNNQMLLVKENIKRFETLHRYLDFNS